ncbi:MAG: amidohydrolase [Acidobacteria bacterium]|nr:MAG: amidohydrolase [Acidobacteriota bacterium]
MKQQDLKACGDLSRREFLTAGLGIAAAPLLAVPALSEPILDLHQHALYMGRSDQQLVDHQQYNGVTITNLLAGDGWMLSELGGNADCAAIQAKYPDQFVRFACADPVEGRMLDIGGSALEGPVDDLSPRKKSIIGLSWPAPAVKLRSAGLGAGRRHGAIGIGEMKFHVPVDSLEMDRVYKLAEELHIPVLLHFEYHHYNLELENLEKVLKRFPKVNFIGHAQTWWGHISANLNATTMYPKGPVKPGGLVDKLLANYPNIYGDLSADSGLNAVTRDPEFSRGFLERHSQKLIWGSDCACRDGKGGGTSTGYCIAARCLAALRKLVSSQRALRRILYDNGTELLDLSRA